MKKILLLLSLLLLSLPLRAQTISADDRVVALEPGDAQVFSTLLAYGGQLLPIDFITLETRPDPASQVLTFTDTPLDAETFTINATVYTVEDGAVATAFEVNDAATAALFIVNLCAAINADGVGDGSDYAAGTTAHPDVSCTASTATTLTVASLVGGSDDNGLATTETSTVASFGGATLEDVVDPSITYSGVDSLAATADGLVTTTVTDGDPEVATVTVAQPFYRITCVAGADGSCVVKLVP